MSQKQISEILGIGTSFISQIETGKDPMPGYIPEKLSAAYGKDEVEKYNRESSFGFDSDRLLRARYKFPIERASSRRVSSANGVSIPVDGASPESTRLHAEWVDRVLRTFERRDELALMQQREYERQGVRIDELLEFLRTQG